MQFALQKQQSPSRYVSEVSSVQNSWGTTHTGPYFSAINLTCIPLNDFSDALHSSICVITHNRPPLKMPVKRSDDTANCSCMPTPHWPIKTWPILWYLWMWNSWWNWLKTQNKLTQSFTFSKLQIFHKVELFGPFLPMPTAPPTVSTTVVSTCIEDILKLPPAGKESC